MAKMGKIACGQWEPHTHTQKKPNKITKTLRISSRLRISTIRDTTRACKCRTVNAIYYVHHSKLELKRTIYYQHKRLFIYRRIYLCTTRTKTYARPWVVVMFVCAQTISSCIYSVFIKDTVDSGHCLSVWVSEQQMLFRTAAATFVCHCAIR